MGYNEKFWKALLNASKYNTREEAIAEFKVTGVRRQEGSKCICTHVITEQCEVKSVVNNKVLIIGNCCIKRFFSAEEAAKADDLFKKLARKTRDCIKCNKRYPKDYARDMDEKLCNDCFAHYKTCGTCDKGWVYCENESEFRWKTMCTDCFKTKKTKEQAEKPLATPRTCKGYTGHKCKKSINAAEHWKTRCSNCYVQWKKEKKKQINCRGQ
ncbi:uncharacterized protein EV422DRAFT_510348 [Fimicolochytrium jonesii]|uniref:uncharacterized protein n=1 Tax=Fimicolochytrium jonesii TaxID=1396493 RepID=UPI0022FE1F4E|nr:uncharacterized protein EV422DRAFT_510348 [Fimicolochytrium jonesii]KAI8815685.1 hypothetical protein EV422DRAFT_510348 [Fimicolochytrium jonesii]